MQIVVFLRGGYSVLRHLRHQSGPATDRAHSGECGGWGPYYWSQLKTKKCGWHVVDCIIGKLGTAHCRTCTTASVNTVEQHLPTVSSRLNRLLVTSVYISDKEGLNQVADVRKALHHKASENRSHC